jgi:hypothetical protein
MKNSGLFGWMCAGTALMLLAACRGGNATEVAAAAAPQASAPASAMANADRACPLTVEQAAAVTGAPMRTQGACTFFPANGRDVPHVFYVVQNPMVCTSIKPSELGFTETVAALPARAAYVKDQLDGAHVLVCPNGNGRAFDVVVDIKNDKPKNREAAIALAKQVLAGR